MENEKLILTILTSSVISAALTSFINWLIQKNNYKNDYYKKILEKRLLAYERLVNISEMLTSYTNIHGQKIATVFSKGFENFRNFYEGILFTPGNGFWVTPKTRVILRDFTNFLYVNVLNEFENGLYDSEDEEEADKEKLVQLGIKYKTIIKQFKMDLDEELNRDFRELHNIRKFIRNNSKSKK